MVCISRDDEVEIEASVFQKACIWFGTIARFFRRIQPVAFVDSGGRIVLPAERSADGQDRLVLAVDSPTYGKDPIGVAVGAQREQIEHTIKSPYASGGGFYHATGILKLLSKTIYVDSDAAGAIAAVVLLPAGGAGVKWVVVEIVASGFVIATLAAANALMVLSDAPADNAVVHAGPAPTQTYGPFKQSTANTAMQLSGGAGTATALSRFPVTVRYWAGS